jgi:hypothetical protein
MVGSSNKEADADLFLLSCVVSSSGISGMSSEPSPGYLYTEGPFVSFLSTLSALWSSSILYTKKKKRV